MMEVESVEKPSPTEVKGLILTLLQGRRSSGSTFGFAPQLHESAGGLPKTKLVSHSCSLAGSTSAMKVSNWGGHLHFREVGESYTLLLFVQTVTDNPVAFRDQTAAPDRRIQIQQTDRPTDSDSKEIRTDVDKEQIQKDRCSRQTDANSDNRSKQIQVKSHVEP
ncbi:hypothetical protein Tco_0814389 [Tanacetum coccineum]